MSSSSATRRSNRWVTAVAGAKVDGGIYRDRAFAACAARVQMDPVARLGLAAHQADPYRIYDQIRLMPSLHLRDPERRPVRLHPL